MKPTKNKIMDYCYTKAFKEIPNRVSLEYWAKRVKITRNIILIPSIKTGVRMKGRK